jgi:hypothetical protein
MSNKNKRNPGRPRIPSTLLFDDLPLTLAEHHHMQIVIDVMPVHGNVSKPDGDALVNQIHEVLDKFHVPLTANINANNHPLQKCTVISCIYLQRLVEALDDTYHESSESEH